MQIINFSLDFATISQKLKVERPRTLNMQCWFCKSQYFWVKKKRRVGTYPTRWIGSTLLAATCYQLLFMCEFASKR